MSFNESNEIIDETNEEEEIEEEWITLNNHPDYEININYPHQIRKKSNNDIVAECNNGIGYLCCLLNGKTYYKHRIIAQQFIENDDPENKTEIDHINNQRDDNHISNLRWCSRSDNCKNKTKSSVNTDIIYEYFDKIDDESIEVTDYGNHQFEFYYYSEKEDSFYFYNGIKYRKLHVNIHKGNGSAFVNMYDTNKKYVKILFNKFKRLYDIDF